MNNLFLALGVIIVTCASIDADNKAETTKTVKSTNNNHNNNYPIEDTNNICYVQCLECINGFGKDDSNNNEQNNNITNSNIDNKNVKEEKIKKENKQQIINNISNINGNSLLRSTNKKILLTPSLPPTSKFQVSNQTQKKAVKSMLFLLLMTTITAISKQSSQLVRTNITPMT